MPARRLPVYLVIDTSGSMVGEPIEAVRQGLSALLADLRDDPEAIETVWLSLITFANRAEQVVPLTPLMMFRPPTLAAGGQTAIGDALRVLDTALTQDIQGRLDAGKRDWKPLVFIMTDGTPTDSWQSGAEKLRGHDLAGIIVCGAGSDIDSAVLRAIGTSVIDLSRLRPGDLGGYFSWVSREIRDAARAPA